MEFGDRNFHWARSSVGLERTPDKREVGSSNLPGPIFDLLLTIEYLLLPTIVSQKKSKLMRFRGRSSTGRAPALQAGGCRFEPDRLH